jgi:hypothetical protein
MATTGNVFPGTGSSVARSTATAWTTPTNIGSDNGSDATCSSGASGSAYLVASNFNFASIPSDATILGFTVRVEASEHSAGTESLNAQLQGSTAALVGSSKATTISNTAKVVYTYGGAADMWGTSLTVAEIQDSDFGVRLWFTTTHDVRIDYVTVAVEYSTAVNEALTGSAVTLSAGTLVPVPEVTPLGLEIAAASGAVGAPESHGQVITSALQTLSEFVISVALAGAQIVSGAGSVTSSVDEGGDVTVPLTGSEVVVSAGTVGPDYTRALTGEAVTLSAGTASYGLDPTFGGQAITSASGTLVAEGPAGVTVHISGVEAEFVLGSIVSGGQSLTGSASTGAAGTQTPNLAVAISGAEITSGQGFVSSGIDADDTYIFSSQGSVASLTVEVALEGDQMDAGQGSLTATGDAFGTLTGSASTPAAGTLAPDMAVALSGSAVAGELGTFGAPGGAALTGSAVTVTAGDVFTTDDRSFALTGEQMTVGQGDAVTSYLAFATGEQLTVSAQDIGPRGIELTGQQIAVEQEDLIAPSGVRPGKSKAKGRDKKIVVTIDEQQFIVESEEEAVALLEQAAEVAAETAAQQVAKVAESSKRGRKKALASAREALQTPVIAVEDFDAQSYIAKITQTYAEALKEIETKKKAEDKRTQDEEDAIILNLLNL